LWIAFAQGRLGGGSDSENERATEDALRYLNRGTVIRGFHLLLLAMQIALSPLHGEPTKPVQAIAPPKAIYTPQPVYRPEWVKQGLSGKGIVLVSINNHTGKVTGVRMWQSTGNKLLDGAALEAYSQWRFQAGTGSQVKIPIEFKPRPNPQAARRPQSRPTIFYGVLILFGLAGVLMAIRRKRGTG
jgi:TonB family protein